MSNYCHRCGNYLKVFRFKFCDKECFDRYVQVVGHDSSKTNITATQGNVDGDAIMQIVNKIYESSEFKKSIFNCIKNESSTNTSESVEILIKRFKTQTKKGIDRIHKRKLNGDDDEFRSEEH